MTFPQEIHNVHPLVAHRRPFVRSSCTASVSLGPCRCGSVSTSPGDDLLTIPTSTLETETARLRATLRPTCSRLSQTVDVLRDSSPDAILEGRWRLEEVHDILGRLASEQQMPELAARLGRIRDSLAGHLAAALDCSIARVRPEVIA